MADDEHGTPGPDLGLVQQFISQLRATTERLESLTGFGEHLPTAPGALPLPGTLSAAQLRSIVDSIAAQRHSIEALKAQLSSFDEQLAALEKILGPFAEWSKTWAELEEWLLRMGRGPGPRKLSPGPRPSFGHALTGTAWASAAYSRSSALAAPLRQLAAID
jgi:hypothetical protein